MKTNTLPLIAGLGLILLVSSGCAPGPKSTRGFVFPEGDLARGKSTFVELKCFKCHQVKGVANLPEPTIPSGKVVVLGGKVRNTKTYGDLLTAIIHPAESVTAQAPDRTASDEAMPVVNDLMTVQQMLDLVTFLSPRYEKLEQLYHDGMLP